MVGEFNMEQWATEYQLTEDTLRIIEDKGFNSKKSISKLTVDIMKKDCKGMSIGQSLLLQEAGDSLQMASKDKSTVQTGLEATPSVSTAGGRYQFLQEKLSNGESHGSRM